MVTRPAVTKRRRLGTSKRNWPLIIRWPEHSIGVGALVSRLHSDVSTLLRAWSDGDHRALDALTPIVYAELRRLAHRYMRRERADHSLQTTALPTAESGSSISPAGPPGANAMSPTPIPAQANAPKASTFRFDLVAGLTAAAVVLPKAMAYASVAGLPVAVGLYTAFIPMAIYALLGTSPCSASARPRPSRYSPARSWDRRYRTAIRRAS